MIKAQFMLLVLLSLGSCQTPNTPLALPTPSSETAQAWQDGESAYLQYLAQEPNTPLTLSAIQGQWIDVNGIGQWTFYGEAAAQAETDAPDVFQLFAQLRHQWHHPHSPVTAQQTVYWTPHTGWQSGILSTEGTQP